MDEILALITARSGSKSITDKNLQKIGNKSLLEWTAACISKCSVFSKSIISTDSYRYVQEVTSFMIEAPFLRPEDLAQDSSTDTEVFSHLIDWLQKNSRIPKWIAHFRPTTPFRNPSFIDEQIATFMADSRNREWTAVRSVHLMSESAYKFFELDSNEQLVSIFTRESDLESSNLPKESFPKTYIPNGYIDLINTENFIRQGKLHGNKVKALITEPTLEIDTQLDLYNANLINSSNSRLMDLVF